MNRLEISTFVKNGIEYVIIEIDGKKIYLKTIEEKNIKRRKYNMKKIIAGAIISTFIVSNSLVCENSDNKNIYDNKSKITDYMDINSRGIFLNEFFAKNIKKEEDNDFSLVDIHEINNLLPYNSGHTKSYMFYQSVTDKFSKQYKLLNSNNILPDFRGFMKEDEYYCVALSPMFGEIGSKYLITLNNGNEIKVIKADEKKEEEIKNGIAHPDGSIVEFILDKNSSWIKENTYKNGFVLGGGLQKLPEFSGDIIRVQKIVENKNSNVKQLVMKR